jgi:hypothetical protein
MQHLQYLAHLQLTEQTGPRTKGWLRTAKWWERNARLIAISVSEDPRFIVLKWWCSPLKPVMMIKFRYVANGSHYKLQKLMRVPSVVKRNRLAAIRIGLVQQCKWRMKNKNII